MHHRRVQVEHIGRVASSMQMHIQPLHKRCLARACPRSIVSYPYYIWVNGSTGHADADNHSRRHCRWTEGRREKGPGRTKILAVGRKVLGSAHRQRNFTQVHSTQQTTPARRSLARSLRLRCRRCLSPRPPPLLLLPKWRPRTSPSTPHKSTQKPGLYPPFPRPSPFTCPNKVH
jgi:hypothetical protein